jgi:hypothetical protein
MSLKAMIGGLVVGDAARLLKKRTKKPLDVMGNDHDALLASWEDFYRGGTGVWYNERYRPDTYSEQEPMNEEDVMARGDAERDMRSDDGR